MPRTSSEKPEAQTAELETATAEPEAIAEDGFRVIHENVLAKERDGMEAAIYVDVANVPGHGQIARQQLRTSSGMVDRLWRWDPKLRTIGEKLQSFHGESVFGNQMNCHAGNLRKYDPPALETAVRAEMARIPALAEALDYQRFLPRPAFEMGHGQIQRAINRGSNSPSFGWPEYINRHLNGDFGNWGKLDLEHEFSDAERFALALHAVHLQNLSAIRLRAGCVRSEFRVPGCPFLAYVLTCFMSNKAEGIKTIAWISSN